MAQPKSQWERLGEEAPGEEQSAKESAPIASGDPVSPADMSATLNQVFAGAAEEPAPQADVSAALNAVFGGAAAASQAVESAATTAASTVEQEREAELQALKQRWQEDQAALRRQQAEAEEAKRKAEAEAARTYKVEPGDSLSAIALKLYGDASRWPEIFDANRDTISNPNLIRVGQELRIP